MTCIATKVDAAGLDTSSRRPGQMTGCLVDDGCRKACRSSNIK